MDHETGSANHRMPMNNSVWYQKFTVPFIENCFEQVRSKFPSKPCLKTCIRLAIPAVILGTAVRLWILSVWPDAFYGADSSSFWQAAENFYLKGEIDFNSKRRYLYPLFLALLAKLPFVAPVHSVAIFQHLAGILAIFGFVYVARWVMPHSRWVVIIASCVFAVWYKNLNYEKEVLADVFFLYSLIFCTAFTVAYTGSRGRSYMGCMLAFAAIVVGLKPGGKAVWISVVALLFLFNPNPLKWPRSGQFAFLVGACFFLTVGSSFQANKLLLSSALPFVPKTGEVHQKYREALLPFIVEAEEHQSNYVWEQKYFKKRLLMKHLSDDPRHKWISDKNWQNLLRNNSRTATVFGDLAREGIFSEPVKFLKFGAMKTAIGFVYTGNSNNLDPKLFSIRQLDRINTKFDKRGKRASKLLFFRIPNEEIHSRLVQTLDNTQLNFLIMVVDYIGQSLPVTTGGSSAEDEQNIGWFGLLAIVGLIATLCFQLNWGILAFLPVTVLVFTTYIIGDKVARYAMMGDWMILIFGAAGIWWIFQGIKATANMIIRRSGK